MENLRQSDSVGGRVIGSAKSAKTPEFQQGFAGQIRFHPGIPRPASQFCG